MKTSIRKQIAVIFIGLMGCVLVLSMLANGFFLESYYINNKQSTLIDVYEEMNKTSNDEELFSQNQIAELSELAEVGNISFVVITNNNTELLAAAQNQEKTEELVNRLLAYLLDKNQARSDLLEDEENYEIHSVKDEMGNGSYLEMWGYLDRGNAFILRTPLESIRESVALSNRFLIYITVVMIAVGSLFVWYFSKRITDPILQLAEISKRMTNLDFEAKYTSGGSDEIGVLGEHFNMMSEKLEKTVSELKHANYELQKDIEQKEKIDTMRTEFIGNVSHELKTPIALIQGYAEGLKEGISEEKESRDFYCDVILDEANKMNQLVKSLLTLNQIELGKKEIELTRFNLVELVQGVIWSNEILIQQKAVQVRFEQKEPVYVWADEFQIEQVIRNYLSNALNHVTDENVIDIRMRKNEANDKVRVSVFNTGNPIPEEVLEQIWEKFYKADKSHAREYGGSGIGLSIVKAIMESMKQDYGVKNYENGVAFWFELDMK